MNLRVVAFIVFVFSLSLGKALHAATAQLFFQYAGSTTSTLSVSQVLAGSGIDPNPNLTQVDLMNPAFQTTAWKHYFQITIAFTPDPGQDLHQALRIAIFSVFPSSGIVPITPAGVPGGTRQKYFGYTYIDD